MSRTQRPRRFTDQLVTEIIGSINPADIESEVMARGAAHGYEHMVAHTLTVIRGRFHDYLHDRGFAPSSE